MGKIVRGRVILGVVCFVIGVAGFYLERWMAG